MSRCSFVTNKNRVSDGAWKAFVLAGLALPGLVKANDLASISDILASMLKRFQGLSRLTYVSKRSEGKLLIVYTWPRTLPYPCDSPGMKLPDTLIVTSTPHFEVDSLQWESSNNDHLQLEQINDGITHRKESPWLRLELIPELSRSTEKGETNATLLVQ